jgi:hypothetical protein
LASFFDGFITPSRLLPLLFQSFNIVNSQSLTMAWHFFHHPQTPLASTMHRIGTPSHLPRASTTAAAASGAIRYPHFIQQTRMIDCCILVLLKSVKSMACAPFWIRLVFVVHLCKYLSNQGGEIALSRLNLEHYQLYTLFMDT